MVCGQGARAGNGGWIDVRHNQQIGLLYGLAGFALLSLGDAVVKSMAGQWPGPAIAALRYTLGASGLGAVLAWRDGRAGFAFPRPVYQAMRGLAVSLATVAFFTALTLMPLATATTILFTAPIITALLGALLLREPLRRETWIASFVAFAGVLIVLRPNFAVLGLAALLPLLAALGNALMVIGNRAVAGRASALAMQFSGAVIAAPILVCVVLIGHSSGFRPYAMHWPSASVLARCGFIACSATAAHTCIYLGTTRADAATIAPMTYVQLLVATALGWGIYGERPDALALLGAGVIVGAGVYLWRAGRPPLGVPVSE
jgi:drug/metabolite transporter (DMT)-like permease